MRLLRDGSYKASINPDDFQSMDGSCESFQKVWVEKDYDEKVRVVALDDGDELNSTFTADTFASWFSYKLAQGCIRWFKLNREPIAMAEAADAVSGDAEEKAIARSDAANRVVKDNVWYKADVA